MFPSRCTRLTILCSLVAWAAASGCTQDMADQPRYEPLEASAFFANGMASRPLVQGTVARGYLRVDTEFYQGTVDGKPTATFPLRMVSQELHLSGDDREITEKILVRGARFNIFCTPCHGQVGDGDGMVVKRGFPAPPSLHIDRLREAPVGHFYDVATRGFGRMPTYAVQVPPVDRWAIVAYIRALQLSQHAAAQELPAQDRAKLPDAEREN